MRRMMTLAFIVVVGTAVAQIEAQSRPDFSGTWALITNDTGGTPVFGQTLKLVQDAKTLTVESTGYLINDSRGASESRTVPYTTVATHTLDGDEHPLTTTFTMQDGGTLAARAEALLSIPDTAVSKGLWTGRQLIVMTYRTFVMNRTTTPPTSFTRRQTVRESFQLNSDGTLAVDRLIVGEPLPWGRDLDREQPAPMSVRSVYKK